MKKSFDILSVLVHDVTRDEDHKQSNQPTHTQ
jgi:hypothetical protein